MGCAYCGVKFLPLGAVCSRCRPIVKRAIEAYENPHQAVRRDMATGAGIDARVAIALRARRDAPPMTEEECFRGFLDGDAS